MKAPQAHAPPFYDLRIDELVLDGFPAAARYAIAAALERELTRLLSRPDAPFSDRGQGGASAPVVADRLDAGVVTLASDASPQRIGVAAARAIGRQLGALSGGGGPAQSGGVKS